MTNVDRPELHRFSESERKPVQRMELMSKEERQKVRHPENPEKK